MTVDIDKINKMLPLCLSSEPGDRQAAWNRVQHFLMPAVTAGHFSPSQFQIGRRSAPSGENIQDIIDRETAYHKGVIDKKNKKIAALERQITEVSNAVGGIDVSPYVEKISEQEAIIAALRVQIQTLQTVPVGVSQPTQPKVEKTVYDTPKESKSDVGLKTAILIAIARLPINFAVSDLYEMCMDHSGSGDRKASIRDAVNRLKTAGVIKALGGGRYSLEGSQRIY